MKSRLGFLPLAAVVLAAATVSATVLPVALAPAASPAARPSWHDLKVRQVVFPQNLDIDSEGIYLFKTAEQWQAFWASVPDVTEGGKPIGATPQVNFATQFAVLASYGWKVEGHAISVTHARSNGQEVMVTVERQQPNPENCRPLPDDTDHSALIPVIVYGGLIVLMLVVDPFYGGIAIIEKPPVENFESIPVGAVYRNIMEPKAGEPTRDCTVA